MTFATKQSSKTTRYDFAFRGRYEWSRDTEREGERVRERESRKTRSLKEELRLEPEEGSGRKTCTFSSRTTMKNAYTLLYDIRVRSMN